MEELRQMIVDAFARYEAETADAETMADYLAAALWPKILLPSEFTDFGWDGGMALLKKKPRTVVGTGHLPIKFGL